MSKFGLFVLAWLGCILNAQAQSIDPTTSVRLVWTAVGDDSITGRATAYDIRYLAGILSEATWNLATPVANPPLPSLSGGTDSVRVVGLVPGTMYQFGLKTIDDVLNVSALSNVVTWTTASVGVGPPINQERVWAEPNPFHLRLLIHFTLGTPTQTTLIINDLAGRQLAILLDRLIPAGPQTVIWEVPHLPPGIYWYQLIRGGMNHRGKVVHIN